MGIFFTLYAISVPLFIVGDLLWLGVVAKQFYADKLGYLLGDVVWLPAIIFYGMFLFGLTFFVTYPLHGESLIRIALTGALFGLVTYATYDLTNHATIRDWPYMVTIVDIAWGTFLGTFVATGVTCIYRLLFA